MNKNTCNGRVRVIGGEPKELSLRAKVSLVPTWESSYTWESCSCLMSGWSWKFTNRTGAEGNVPNWWNGKGVETEGKFTWHFEMWIKTEITRSQIQAAEISFLLKVVLLSWDKARSCHSSGDAGPLYQNQLGLLRMFPGCFLLDLYWKHPTGKRLKGRHHWRNYIASLVLEWFYFLSDLGRPSDPPGEAGEHLWGEGCLGFFPWTSASDLRRYNC